MRCGFVCAAVLLGALGCTEQVVFDSDDQWDDPAGWPGVGDGLVMVTNSGDDTLSFLDATTLEVVYVAPTGRVPAEREGPHHGAASADGRSYFVGISNFVPGSGSGPHGSHGGGTVDGYLLKYDVATNAPLGELRVDKSPGDVRASHDGRYVFQSHFDLQAIINAAQAGQDPRLVRARLAVIDAETMTRVAMIPVCPAGHGIAVADDDSEVYVACWGSDELAVVSLAEPVSVDSVVERYSVGPGGGDPTNPRFGPYAVQVDPATGDVWVSNLEGKSLVVFDPSSRTFDVTRTVDTTGSPFFGTFAGDGSAMYVPQQQPDGLIIVDPTTGSANTLVFPPGQCRLPHGVMIMDANRAVVVCEGDHVGVDISPGTVLGVALDGLNVPTVESEEPVGIYPDDLVYIGPVNP